MVALTSKTITRSESRGAVGVDANLELVRIGDPSACEAFVRTHAGRMLAVARRYLKCEHDSADAVQDAFVSAFRGLASFEGASDVATWLHRIVVNACLMKLRSKARRRVVAIEELLPTFDEDGHHARPVRSWSPRFEELADREEVRAEVRECIEHLPDSYREVLILRDVEDLDTETTAGMLGLSPANVKVRLHRARQALRTQLDPLFAEPSPEVRSREVRGTLPIFNGNP